MTVNECVARQKNSSNKKVSRVWICPEVVRNPRVGREYTYTGSIDYRLPEQLSELTVIKQWIEDGTLCMIYKIEGEPINFSS